MIIYDDIARDVKIPQHTRPPIEDHAWYPIFKWGFESMEIVGYRERQLPEMYKSADKTFFLYDPVWHGPLNALFPDDDFNKKVGESWRYAENAFDFLPTKKVPFRGKVERNVTPIHVYGKGAVSWCYSGWMGIGRCFVTKHQWSWITRQSLEYIHNIDLNREESNGSIVWVHCSYGLGYYIEREVLEYIISNDMPSPC